MRTETWPVLAERLVTLREELGYSRLYAAQLMELDYRVLYSLEHGTTACPRMVSVLRAADFYRVSLDYLVGRSDRRSYRSSKRGELMEARLKEARGMLSLREVGQGTQITAGNLSRLESGEIDAPTLPVLVALADAYNYSLDYLMGRSDDRGMKKYAA